MAHVDLTLSPFPRAGAPPGAASPYAIIEIDPHSLPPPEDGYTDLVLDDGEPEPARAECGRERVREAAAEPPGAPDASRAEDAAPPPAQRERPMPRMLVPEALVLVAFLAVGGITAAVAIGGRSGHGTAPSAAAQPVPALAPSLTSTPAAPRASSRPRPPIDIPPLEPAPAPPVQGIVALETPPPGADASR